MEKSSLLIQSKLDLKFKIQLKCLTQNSRLSYIQKLENELHILALYLLILHVRDAIILKHYLKIKQSK